MKKGDYIRFCGTFVDLKVDFDEDTYAYVGYSPSCENFNVAIVKPPRVLFYSDDAGFEDQFNALHEKLDELGLEGFPRDPEYVLDRLKNPPAQIVDLEMTDEEYLAQLAKKQGQR